MKFLVLLISLFLCSITKAATYYISPLGNDATGNGSILNPWKTLKKATSAVTTPNNIIFVTAGTYVESSTSVLAPGVSIEGEGVLSIIKASFSTVFQMIIQAHSSEGTNGNQHISNISMDGQNSTSWAIQIQGRSNFSIHDCIIYNFAQRGIVWGGRDDNGDAPPTIYATGNSFYNNTVTNCASFDGTYGYGCLNIGGQDGMLIYNNTIVTTGTTPGWPIKLWNEGHIKGCKIYNNTLKRPPFPYQYNGIGNYFDFCIEMFYEQGLEIYNNIIEGSVDLNYQTKGAYAYSAYIHDNVFGRTVQGAHCETGIWLEEYTEYCTIENNTFKSISQPIMFSLRPGNYMNNITIQKNLAYNIGKTDGTREGTAIGIIMNDNTTNYSASNWFVYNNTFLALAGSNAPYFGVNLPGGNSSTNVKLVNNIISNFNYYAVSCDYGSHVNGLQVNNNTKYNNGSSNSILFTNGNPVNYTNTGNLNSNPLLDLSFIPIIGSPCIDAGINIGLPFSGAAPEMGFFEIGITNIPPTANAGPDKTITLPTDSVTLNGSGNDPDGNITAYQWTKISGPTAGNITNPNAATTTVTVLAQGTYQFELKVTDNGGAIGRDTMQVTVNAASNIPPTANAGPDQTISLPTNTVTLAGSGNDPDGNITTYKWTKISGPACTITNSNNATTTVTGMLLGIYKFELKVTDNGGAIGRDTMQVTVNPDPNIPPTANAGPDETITLPTDSVTLSGSGNDPDGNITAYQWTKISGPACTITNSNSATTTVTGMLLGIYKFELKVTDNAGAIGKDTMQVTVNPDPNIPPTANAGPDQTIALPTDSVTLNGSGNDPDGNITAYQWTKISGPASSIITNPNAATTTVTRLVEGIYQFELKVTDNGGAIGKDTVQITVKPNPNIAPAANAGPDQTIALPTDSVTLSGSGNDPDGSITAYQWSKISGPAAGTITNPNAASTTVTGLVQGTYQFELKVTDNAGATGTDTMQVIVNAAPNIPPTADAGPDQTIALPTNTVTLTGTGNDPDGNITAYKWTKISGPACTITNSNNATTTVIGMQQGSYQFELKVTDNAGAVGKDTMQVTVNPDPNIPPTADAGPDQIITLPTNTVTLAGSGTDPDGNITTYKWRKISGPACIITNSNNATTTVIGLRLGIYKFELKVTDNGGAIGRDTMQVTVNPEPNNIPPTANAGPDQTITLPTDSIILSGNGTDPDGNIIAYTWTKISGPAAGTITNPDSATTTVNGLVQGIYQFELNVTDDGGAIGSDTMQVTVNPDPNIAPTANAGPDQTITLPTNNVNLTGSGNDPDGNITAYQWTKISGPAAGTITNPNNASTTVTGLAQGIYKFELKVTDNGGAIGRDTMQVTVNTAPNIPPTANAGPDQIITLPTNTVTLTGSGNDPDGNITAYQWTKISGPAAGIITNPNNASTTVTGLAQGIYKFELKVTDNGGAIGRDTMQVTVNPPPNIPPTANAGPDKTITLPTNTVTLTGSGNDPDGNITAYQWTKISGPAAGNITNPNNASTTVTGLVQGIYKFELKVTDNGGAVGRDTMQVTVNAAPNIPPTANAGPDKTITLPINTVTLAGSGNDPDGNITAYQWTKISGPAAGTITSPNSASTTVTGLVQGVYKFELKVTDNNNAIGKDTMQVTVNPAPNIPPTANAGPDKTITLPTNTVTLTGSGNDPDGNITAYQWTKISGPAAGTITNPISASTTVTGLVQGTYKFELKVNDNNNASGKDTMQVTVNPPPNIPPTANAGPDKTITLPTNTVTLAGSGNDPDGNITAYQWAKISGPAAGTITNPGSAITTVTGLNQGAYEFELKVTDNNGATDRDTVLIIIMPAPNIPPTANAGPDQTVNFPDNSSTLNGSGNDADGYIARYEWKQLSGPSNNVLFSLVNAVTFINNLVPGEYEFELTVTDSRGATASDIVKVIVTGPPTFVPEQNVIKIFPNPVVDIATLDVKATKVNTVLSIIIFDIQGKIVFKKEIVAGQFNFSEKLDLSKLSKGTYMVSVFFDNAEKQTHTIIKM